MKRRHVVALAIVGTATLYVCIEGIVWLTR